VEIDATNYRGAKKCIAVTAEEQTFNYWWQLFVSVQGFIFLIGMMDIHYKMVYE
jgi:hypothetical protein